jgi:chemotaxis protein histidine kinase CheA
MPKLKALRGSIGTYGRVAAGGIVEVDDAEAKKLLETKRFQRASDADVKAAQAAQRKFLKVAVAGATPGFAPVAEAPQPVEDAFGALEIEQQRAEIQRGIEALAAEASRLSAIEAQLIERHDLQEDRHADLKRREEDLQKREEALAASAAEKAQKQAAEADAADKAKKAGK